MTPPLATELSSHLAEHVRTVDDQVVLITAAPARSGGRSSRPS